MARLANWHKSSFVVTVCVCASSSAADIYRAQSTDGSYLYASHPLSASYILYLQGNDETKNNTPLKASPIRLRQRASLDPLIERYARRYSVDTDLVRAIIDVESGFNSAAVSPKGAAGAMQLMPATAARYGVTHRSDPAQNIQAGIRYLKDLMTLHNGNVALALASYNAGEGTIAKYGKRIPPYRETMLYVPAVLTRLHAARNTPSP